MRTGLSREIVLLTDFGSNEGSRNQLVRAVELLTGAPPLSVDARHFLDEGGGKATCLDGKLRLEVPDEGLDVSPSVLIVYEIPPDARRRFESFQHRAAESDVVCFGTEVDGWRNATEKDRTVERFALAGVPQMPTASLTNPTEGRAIRTFEQLGGDVWARPQVGLGGQDVFHITTYEQLAAARTHYALRKAPWLMARDAMNFTSDGRRHQYRVVVLNDQILRVCEHIQDDVDAPCNESRGARSIHMAIADAPRLALDLAIRATSSLGLGFGGADVAVEQGGAVFEVNVHPVIAGTGFEGVALPYVSAHLAELARRATVAP